MQAIWRSAQSDIVSKNSQSDLTEYDLCATTLAHRSSCENSKSGMHLKLFLSVSDFVSQPGLSAMPRLGYLAFLFTYLTFLSPPKGCIRLPPVESFCSNPVSQKYFSNK